MILLFILKFTIRIHQISLPIQNTHFQSTTNQYPGTGNFG